MSLPMTLDEYPRAALVKELARRTDCNERGRCDYCERPIGSGNACKFPDRHNGEDWKIQTLLEKHAPEA
jgi:hypothetical protein